MTVRTIPKSLHELRLTQQQAAGVLGMSVTTFRDRFSARIPAEEVIRDGQRMTYSLATIAECVRLLVADASEDGAVMIGPDSPAKDRLLEAKASNEEVRLEVARMERDRRAGKLLDADEVRAALLAGAGRLRETAGRLERGYGVPAKRIMEEGLAAWKQEVERGVPTG